MTNAEHAIENAVCAIERTSDKKDISLDEVYKKWKETDINLEYIKSDPSEIWEMAMWVYYNYRESVLCDEERHYCDCGYCLEATFTEKPFIVVSQSGRHVECVFNFCPVCGRKIPKDENY